MTIDEQLTTVWMTIFEAEQHLEEIEAEMRNLAEEGMYAAVPSEVWQQRKDGKSEYLYMYFPKIPGSDRYMGPKGRRKLYVGCKRSNIVEARLKAARRRAWENLKRKHDELQAWIDERRRAIRRLARQSKSYPRAALADIGANDDL